MTPRLPRIAESSAALLLAALACGTAEVPPPPPDPMLLLAVRFREADSLMLLGDFAGCRDSLLGLLADGAPRDEALLRLTGLYVERAMEDDLLLLLDSLGSAGTADLEGWRLSVLALASGLTCPPELPLADGPASGAGQGAGAPDSQEAQAALQEILGLQASGASSSTLAALRIDFALRFPWHPEARRLAYDAGKYHDCEQEWAEAAEAYAISQRCSGSWEGDERGCWRLGFCLERCGDLAGADSVLASCAARWPFGYWRDEALFWRARVAGETGDAGLRDSLLLRTAREHPWEYYGMLASRMTGVPTLPAFDTPLVLPSTSPACSAAAALLADGDAAAALGMLRNGPGETLADRALTLSLLGMHGPALTMLRELDQSLRDSSLGMLPDSLLCHYFPAPYADLAATATDTLGLPASMLLAIMREESYFDRCAVSPAGAMGVVQLMPGTAADVARWYGLPPLSDGEFFDPAASVPYGALYIDRQRSRYDGAEALFLAAYNAGPGNADRWAGMHGWNPADPELYIEQITFRETRIYVKKVLASSWIYEGRTR